MMMIPQSSISLFTTVLLCLNFVSSGKNVCTEEQLNEAQRAFRNCVESAKAGIVSSHADAQNEALVCHSLETMLEDCEAEVDQLARCRGRHYVNNLKAIHMSSITQVMKDINHQIDVTSCSVYTEKTFVPVTTASNEPKRLSQDPSEMTIPMESMAESSSSTIWLSFWLLSSAMSLSCALRD